MKNYNLSFKYDYNLCFKAIYQDIKEKASEY